MLSAVTLGPNLPSGGLDHVRLDATGASFGGDAGPGAVVYEQFGGLHLFDLKSGRSRPVPVTIAADPPEVRARIVNVGRRLRNAHISPNGARAVFEARGEILTVPAEKGDARNLTDSAGAMERDPAWSPDGRAIAYFSDASGEYELHLAPQGGMGEATRIAMPRPGFYRAPQWPPDSKKIAFVDSHMQIWYADLDAKKVLPADKERYWNLDNDLVPAWSPDSSKRRSRSCSASSPRIRPGRSGVPSFRSTGRCRRRPSRRARPMTGRARALWSPVRIRPGSRRGCNK